ncbi:threonine dehydrogenase-like Zn-dependent dehydrogenase [Pseudarthrobacter sulfonivorans]|nr:threonine dehydrogenase-like Zn-dependent dehydrogenase [Pseudarthrobacter sulfonivorans]
MKALTWQGKRSVSVENVPDPVIQEPTDAIVRITSTAICGSDLHLYEVLGPYMHKRDVIGHEPMGIVEEVGSAVTNLPGRAAHLHRRRASWRNGIARRGVRRPGQPHAVADHVR